jgi:SAM-dependent methyltransferase
LVNAVRPAATRWRSFMNAPVTAALDRIATGQAAQRAPEPTAAAPAQDVSVLLHHARSARLRQMPPGARTMLSAGCSGAWYFDWIARCYGPVERHLGIEFYMPKPDALPPNVEWIANTASDMSAVATGSCDLIFSGQNLEHLWPREVVGFLLETARVARPGATLVVDNPNRAITRPLNWSHPEHTVEVTPGEAKELVELAGFDVTRLAGIWLTRDARTGAMLPFQPAPTDADWSLPERLLLAEHHPDQSFIWWLEARRLDRSPDAATLRARMAAIFAEAWPERVRRQVPGLARIEHRNGTDWFVAPQGASGPALYGPYMPLKAGTHACTFLFADIGAAGDAPFTRVDVVCGDGSRVLAARELSRADLSDGQVTLSFALPELTFGMQFRCFALGGPGFACRVQPGASITSTAADVGAA